MIRGQTISLQSELAVLRLHVEGLEEQERRVAATEGVKQVGSV